MLKVSTDASVSNSSMKKLDEIKIEINSSKNVGMITTYAYPAVTAEIRGEGNFVDSSGNPIGKSISVGGAAETYIRFGLGRYNIFITNKNNFKKFECYSNEVRVNLSEFNYGGTHTIMDSTNIVYGRLQDAENFLKSARVFEVSGSDIFGNIAAFEGNATIEKIRLNNCDCTGDITSLGGCVKLTSLKIVGQFNIVGSLDSLANAMTASGRTSGTLAITDQNNVTKTYTFSSSGWAVA